MRPFLKGMQTLKTCHKGSTLFDAHTASGKRRAMAGTHWPVLVDFSHQALTMLFEGHMEQQDGLAQVWTPGCLPPSF